MSASGGTRKIWLDKDMSQKLIDRKSIFLIIILAFSLGTALYFFKILQPTRSFQKFLKNNCKDDRIEQDLLPLKVNNKSLLKSESWECLDGGGGYLRITLSDRGQWLYVYDSYSKELGSGFSKFVQSGTPVYENKGIKVTVFPYTGDVGPSFLEDVRILATVKRTLILKDGEKIFINYTIIIIPPDDLKLKEIASSFKESVNLENGETKYIVSSFDDLEKEVVRRFFSNENTIEYKRIIEMVSTVESFVLK